MNDTKQKSAFLIPVIEVCLLIIVVVITILIMFKMSLEDRSSRLDYQVWQHQGGSNYLTELLTTYSNRMSASNQQLTVWLSNANNENKFLKNQLDASLRKLVEAVDEAQYARMPSQVILTNVLQTNVYLLKLHGITPAPFFLLEPEPASIVDTNGILFYIIK